MNKIKYIFASFFFSLLLLFNVVINTASATGVYDLPVISAGEDVWVYDDAEAISRTTEGKLTSMLQDLAKSTGNEVRMVVINRLDYGQTIDSLATELFQTWYPTPESAKNQTLVVVDTLSNKGAIASGEGVTDLLTPDISDSVVKETLPYSLKDLQYNQALISAGDRLVAVLSGQDDPGAPEIEEIKIEGTFTTAEETDDRNATIWTIVLLLLATVIPMVTYFWYVGFPGN